MPRASGKSPRGNQSQLAESVYGQRNTKIGRARNTSWRSTCIPKSPSAKSTCTTRASSNWRNCLKRSVGSVSLKLSNFARLDPALQARGMRGMRHGAKGEMEIWREFAEHPETLAFESERLRANRLGQPIEQVADVDTGDLPPAGREREATVRVRVNQSFFRSRILSAYNFRCCVTGLTVQPLLTASHIIPWAEDEKNRLNPRNSLCLNALHDRAFDRHLMWIEDNYVIRFSPKLTSTPQLSTINLCFMADGALTARVCFCRSNLRPTWNS